LPFKLDRVYGLGCTPDDVYASSMKPLLPTVVDGGSALMVVLGHASRYDFVEGRSQNDFFGGFQ
jgi:hypothetical protein